MAHHKRYFLMVVVLLGLLIAGGFWFWTGSTSSALLAQTKTELRTRGERLSVEDFDTKDSTNASPLASLASAITNFSPEADWPGSFLAMNCVSAGYARALWRQPEIPLFGDDTGSWNKLEMDIEQAELGLQQCREMFFVPPPSSAPFSARYPSAHAMEWRRAVQWLQGAALLHLHHQDLDQALTNLLSLINATRVYQDDVKLILQLTRQDIGRITLATIWEALQTPGWTDPQLVHLNTALDQVDFVDPLAASLEAFRALGLESFQQVRQEPRRYSSYTSGQPVPEPWKAWFWLKFRADQDELNFLTKIQRQIDAARLVASQRNWHAAQANMNSDGFNSDRLILSASLLRAPDEALLHAVRLAILREMACTAIALRRYQLARGELPNQLDQLVPDFLKQMPIDYMNGQPLRYRLQNPGNWLLYSVGLDAVDDQGLAGDQSNFDEPWLGADWVWPRAVAE